MAAEPFVTYFRPEDPNDGVTLFGTRVAQALRGAGTRGVHEVVDRAGDPAAHGALSSLRHYRTLGRAMNRGDVAHVEYRPTYFRGRSRLDGRYFHFRAMIDRPLVLSAHDVFDTGNGGNGDWLMGLQQGKLKRTIKQGLLLGTPAAAAWTRDRYEQLIDAELFRGADRVVVHTSEQRDRLMARGVEPERVRVLLHPLLVEPSEHDPRHAKAALGLEDRFVVTKLGFIHDRKDYETVLRALADAPEQVTLLIAGGPFPGDEARQQALEASARELGVENRIHITGLLDDDGIARAVAATDLAVASFRTMSASGTLAVWIAQGTPLLAVDLPPVAELVQAAPGSIETFAVGDSAALTRGIEAAAGGRTDDGRKAAVQRLRDALSLKRYARSLCDIYAELTG